MIKLETKHIGQQCTISGRYAGNSYFIRAISADKKVAFVEAAASDPRLRAKLRYEKIPAAEINLVADKKGKSA